MKPAFTLEPVYKLGGGSPKWVDWFFRMFTGEPHLGFNYVQVGQENSFTWEAMKKGFVYQTELVARLQKEGKVRVETLAETGRWFKERYSLTPPTSVVTMEDEHGGGRKTYWFNCRNYRANLLWEGRSLKIRDLHVFDERLRSEYLDHPDTLPVFRYETFPLVDGCLWSKADRMAGLHLEAPAFKGGDLQFVPMDDEKGQDVIWLSENGKGRFVFSFTEDGLSVISKGKVGDWNLVLSTAPDAPLPFTQITPDTVLARHQGMDYGMKIVRGRADDLRGQNDGTVLRLLPDRGRLVLKPFQSVE